MPSYSLEEQEIIRMGERAAELIARGDLKSDEPGSGARADAGKASWGLMPLSQLTPLLTDNLIAEGPNPEDPITLDDCVWHIAYFQRTGEGAEDLLRHSLCYLMDEMNVDFWDACEEVIRVWEHGEKKYASFNWMKGMSWNSVIGCYMRHVRKLKKGTIKDEESGRHHGAHLVCNAMMLVHYSHYYKQGNDLPVKWYTLQEDSNGSIKSGKVL